MINIQDIFTIQGKAQFERLALEVFQYQFEHNIVYRSYCDLLCVHPSQVTTLEAIPFLPIQFFKTHAVITGNGKAEKVFESSGTTSDNPSKHFVADISTYQHSFYKCFELFYGTVETYTILALLPSYLERNNSSLVYMVNDLITKSGKDASGFFLNNHHDLYKTLQKLEASQQKTILIGVSFALLDFISKYQLELTHTMVMETGGMKGRRKELIREALHMQLQEGFGVSEIHSEYGMTELLSQAYSKGEGKFKTPPWMKVVIRNPEDPFAYLPIGKTGGLNIIDLANIHSCAFIETQDLGKLHTNDYFEVIGRFDHSEIRGCNLMSI